MGNYYLYKIGQFLANTLPLRVSRALVRLLCDLHYCFSKADRQAVENNLKIVYKTDHVPKEKVRAVFHNFGEYLLEFFTMTKWLDLKFIESNIRINNIKYLNEVLKKGNGCIIVSAHLGSWEMAGAMMAMMGFPLSVVALAHQDPRVNALFNAQREAFGVKVIQTDTAVRRIVEHLRQGRFVAILADRDFGTNGVMMDFWGRRTMVPKGAAFFSMKTGVPIVPVFFLRTGDDRFEINIYPPLKPPSLPESKITEQAMINYIQKYWGTIEVEIRKNPSQWLLFREFWQS